jgi:hypothetical protein
MTLSELIMKLKEIEKQWNVDANSSQEPVIIYDYDEDNIKFATDIFKVEYDIENNIVILT